MTAVVALVAAPAVVGTAADEEAQAEHGGIAVGIGARIAAVVGHAGIPAHSAEGRPAWGQANIDRLGVGVVLREGIPVCAGLGGIVEVAARRDKERGKLAAVDEVHAAAVGPAELHHIQVLVGEGDDDGSLRRRELVAALIEDSTGDLHLLVHGNLGPVVGPILGAGHVRGTASILIIARVLAVATRLLRDGHGRSGRGHHDRLIAVAAADEEQDRQREQGQC